jgi:hypothetical protein
MPIFLRKFYIKEVEQAFVDRAKAIDEATKGVKKSSNSTSKPGISPK